MRSLIAFSIVLAASTLWLPADTAHASGAGLSILQFQGNAYMATQKGGGNVISGQTSWNPTLELVALYVRGSLGLSVLKNAFGGKFLATHVQGLAGMDLFWNFSPEAGGGLQTWVGNGGTHPIITGHLVKNLNSPWFGSVNRLFAGYSHYLLSGNTTSEIKLGVGIQL